MKYLFKISHFFLCLHLMIYSAFPSELRGEELEEPGIRAEESPMLTLAGCVNAATGTFFQVSEDVRVEGAEPLSWNRIYEGSGDFKTEMGHAEGNGLPHTAQYICKEKKQKIYRIENRRGASLDYVRDGQNRATPKTGYDLGYSNLDAMGFNRHRKNQTAEFSQGLLTVHLGGGTTQFFEGQKKNYRFVREIRPSGNHVLIAYDKAGRIKQVRATDPSETENLGEINVSYGDKHYTVTGSNGQSVTYDQEKKLHKRCVYFSSFQHGSRWETVKKEYRNATTKITSSHAPVTLFEHAQQYIYPSEYVRNFQPIPKAIEQNGARIELEYDNLPGQVTKILQPAGAGGKMIPTYAFGYKEKYTDVTDAAKAKTRYHMNDKHQVVEIERLAPNQQRYSSQCFYWDEEGKLITQAFVSGADHILNCKTYIYDDRGNAIQETWVGNLTGKGPDRIFLDAKQRPILKRTEQFSRYYRYSEENQGQLLEQWEDSGPHIRFQYLPNTLLPTAKLIYDQERLVQREFTRYDNKGCAIETIQDNGSSEEPENLTSVTHRTITRCEYSSNGLPLSILTAYFEEGEEKQLKREEIRYADYDLVASRSLYDAEDAFLFTLQYTYDERGRLIRESDSIGRITVTEYDEANRPVAKELLGSGVRTVFTYDRMGQLIATTEQHNNGEILEAQNEYDSRGNLTKKIDAQGHSKRFTYDRYGRKITTNYSAQKLGPSPASRTNEYFFYDRSDNVSSMIDREGNETLYSYNSRGQKSHILHPDGSSEEFTYYLNGTLRTGKARDGSWTWHGYDSFKQEIATETFASDDTFLYATKKEYNGSFLLRSTDEEGVVTEYFYDGAGRLVAQTTSGRTTEFEYDAMGRKTTTRAGGISSIEIQDLANRTIEKRTEDTSGTVYSRETFVYDLKDRCIEQKKWIDDNLSATCRTYFNSHGLPALAIDPEGRETHFQYDFSYQDGEMHNVLKKVTAEPSGNRLIEIHDPHGRVVKTRRYDPFFELIQSSEAIYDTRGEPLEISHSTIYQGKEMDRYTIEWDRDPMGRPLALTEQPGSQFSKTTRYQYDRKGRLAATTKPDGTQLFQTFHPNSLLASLISSDGSIAYHYNYNKKGSLLSVYDAVHDQTTERQYNDHSELTVEKLGNGLEMSYDYTENGAVKKIIFPDLSSAHYSYTGSYLSQIEKFNPQGDFQYQHAIVDRDLLGRPLQEELIEQAGSRVTHWDMMSRPTKITSPSLTLTLDAFDVSGHLTQISRNGSTEHFSYNARAQLTEEKGSVCHSYDYDSIDNRRRKDHDDLEITSLNQLSHDKIHSYLYDANGNCLSNGVHQYKYDALNRLISVTTNSQTTHYQYDSTGRRLSKKTPTKTIRYFYHRGQEIGCYGDSLEELRIPSSTHPIAFELHGKNYVPLYDHRGSVLKLLSSSGEEEANYHYSAFGEELETSKLSPWRFEGQRLDVETGLLCFPNRYYQPSLGRWLTPDPIDFADGANLYAYVHNSPMSYVDPTGLAGCAILTTLLTPEIGVYQDKPIKEFQPSTPEGRTVGHGEVHPLIRVNYQNGIFNNWSDARETGRYISDSHGGVNVLVNFDPTFGKMFGPGLDINDAMLLAVGFKNKATNNLVNDWRRQFAEMDKHGPGGKIIQYCHSRGCLVTLQALQSMTKEEKARLDMRAFAPPKWIHNDGLGALVQYSNLGDVVTGVYSAFMDGTLLGKLIQGQSKESYNHHYLYAGFPDCFAHSLTGCEAYSKKLQLLGREFKNKYGRIEYE